MRAQAERFCPGSHPGHRAADVRDDGGVLLARVDSEQAAELLTRGLIAPQGRRHYRATDAAAVRLWARSRAGGSHTTLLSKLTVRPDRTTHRALQPLLLGNR